MAPSVREIEGETIGWWFYVDAAMRAHRPIVGVGERISVEPSEPASRYITRKDGRRVAERSGDGSRTVSPEVGW